MASKQAAKILAPATLKAEVLPTPETKTVIELTKSMAYDYSQDTLSTENTWMESKYQKRKVEEIQRIIDKKVAEGQQKALMNVAKVLLADETATKKVAHLTGLTEAEIKRLINNTNIF